MRVGGEQLLQPRVRRTTPSLRQVVLDPAGILAIEDHSRVTLCQQSIETQLDSFCTIGTTSGGRRGGSEPTESITHVKYIPPSVSRAWKLNLDVFVYQDRDGDKLRRQSAVDLIEPKIESAVNVDKQTSMLNAQKVVA